MAAKIGVNRLGATVVLALALSGAMAMAQQGFNPRAVDDIKAFLSKSEEGDGLFNQKKYAEAATALAAGHESYQRAVRREPEIGRYDISLGVGKFPALRYFGYGFGPNPNLNEAPNGAVTGKAAGLHTAMNQMWQDACILSGAAQVPNAFFSDAELTDMTEDRLDSLMSELYGPVSTIKLPVPDDEWRNVVLWSRRAALMMEYALQKYPEWKSGTKNWSRNNNKLEHTGDEALADIKKLLAEAEPEYAKIASDAKNAAPKGAKDWIGYKIDDIDKAIAGVKKNGWVSFGLARDIFVTKDYLNGIRQNVAKMYTAEGKQMPADALKDLESRVDDLKSALEGGASKYKFPGGPKNADFEGKASVYIKSKFPGATILKSALDTGQWIITKNDLDIPRYRSMGVLVLAKIPGQKYPWLIFGYVRQDYAGGGTYNSGGTYNGANDVRFQAGG